VNFINIAGHLGADPEVRFTSSGKKVTTLRVATRTRKGQNDDTIWWRVTVWGEQFDKIMPYFKKGSSIVVFGEVHKPEIFNDREGKPQVSMEITAVLIQFSPFGKSGSGQNTQQTQEGAGPQAAPAPGGAPNPYMGFSGADSAAGKSSAPQGQTFDDEVPF